jgi:hypothetical protein
MRRTSERSAARVTAGVLSELAEGAAVRFDEA